MIAHTLAYSGRYLARLQSQVTGNPTLLRWAAETYQKCADTCVNAGRDVDLIAAVPEEIWDGWAADGFRLATRPVSRRAAGATQATFKEMSAALFTAADALERAQRSMDLHVAHFNHAASVYRSAASTATPVQAVKLYFTVAEQCSWWRVTGADIARKLAAELRDVARRLTQAADTADAAAAESAPRLPRSPQEAGALAADEVRRALAAGSRDELMQSLLTLKSTMDRIYTDLADNRQLSAFDEGVLQGFYQRLGPDLLKLPNVLSGSDLTPIGDGIMVLSRTQGPDGRIATPSVVTDLLARPGFETSAIVKPIGKAEVETGTAYTIDPGILALGKIVQASILTPGHDLAADMANKASEMAATAQRLKPGDQIQAPDPAWPFVDSRAVLSTTLDQFVSSASKNHEAMVGFLNDGHAMRNLLAYDWPDEGGSASPAPVAKMFNWIATAGASEAELAVKGYLALTAGITEDAVYASVAEAAMATNPTLSAEFASISRRNIDLYARLNETHDTSIEGGISLRDAERMLMLGALSEQGALIQASAAADYGPARLGVAYQTGDDKEHFDHAGREAANVTGYVAATEWNAKWFREVYETYKHNQQLLDEFYPDRQKTAAIGTTGAYVGNVVTNYIKDLVLVPGTKTAGSPWGVLFSLAPYAANAYYQGGIATPELRMPEAPAPTYGRIQLDVPDAALHLAAHHVALNRFADPREADQYNPMLVSGKAIEQALIWMKKDERAEEYIEEFSKRVPAAYQTFISIRAGAPAIVQQMFGRKAD